SRLSRRGGLEGGGPGNHVRRAQPPDRHPAGSLRAVRLPLCRLLCFPPAPRSQVAQVVELEGPAELSASGSSSASADSTCSETADVATWPKDLMPTARRTHTFTESVIRGMTRLANEHQAINLAQGFPNFATPTVLKEAAAKAIRDDINQYAITWGSKRLRTA